MPIKKTENDNVFNQNWVKRISCALFFTSNSIELLVDYMYLF